MIWRESTLMQINVEEYMNGKDDRKNLFFKKKELLYYDESFQENNNLSVTVCAYIRPDMGCQFILNIILSLGIFEK